MAESSQKRDMSYRKFSGKVEGGSKAAFKKTGQMSRKSSVTSSGASGVCTGNGEPTVGF